MKAYEGVDVYIHVFLTHCTHWIGGWVDPRAGVDDVEKGKYLNLPGLELRHLRRPAHSQSVYQLHCPGFPKSQYS
jgi:hypothetical protein